MSADRAVMIEKIMELVEDYGQARAETALFNANAWPAGEPVRIAGPRYREIAAALRQALAATPAPAQPLSDDQIDDLMPTNTSMPRSDALRWMARAIERHIKGEVKPS